MFQYEEDKSKDKEIVSIDDKFNDDLQEDQMCKLCTMTQAYGS